VLAFCIIHARLAGRRSAPRRAAPTCRFAGAFMLDGRKGVENDSFISAELLSSAKTATK
jgi:hypothetical protein